MQHTDGVNLFLLTVSGTVTGANAEEVRELHNQTAGAEASVAGARALGDLSHNVYVPRMAGSREVLFLDTWTSAEGIGSFFSDPHVAQAAGQLFTEREATVWAPAPGCGDHHLPTPALRPVAALGILRVPVISAEAAAKAFRTQGARVIAEARKHGQVSRQTYLRLAGPGSAEATELLSIESWFDIDGMDRFYADDSNYEEFGGAFAGAPDTATWLPAPGEWREW